MCNINFVVPLHNIGVAPNLHTSLCTKRLAPDPGIADSVSYCYYLLAKEAMY